MKVTFVCSECGKVFTKELRRDIFSVKCPRCKSFDVEPEEWPSRSRKEVGA